jgi:hypothetical protein
LSYSIIIAAFTFEVLLEGLNLPFFLFNESGQLLKFPLINAHVLLIIVQHFVIIFKLGNHVLQLDIFIVKVRQIHLVLFDFICILIELHFDLLLVVRILVFLEFGDHLVILIMQLIKLIFDALVLL